MGGDDVGQRRDLRHQSEILQRLIAGLRLRDRQDGKRADRRERERVAVGRKFQRSLRSDEAAGACPILDDDLLSERLRELAGHEARDGIGRAAGRKRNDQAQRP